MNRKPVPGHGPTKQDWDEVSDHPRTAHGELAQAVAFPGLAESMHRSRGRPPAANPKQAVTLRLDPETVAWFKAQGPDWRARMSEALKWASKA